MVSEHGWGQLIGATAVMAAGTAGLSLVVDGGIDSSSLIKGFFDVTSHDPAALFAPAAWSVAGVAVIGVVAVAVMRLVRMALAAGWVSPVVWWSYRHRWASVMRSAGLSSESGAIPSMGAVHSSEAGQQVRVGMLPGQSTATFAAAASRLAEGFEAREVRVRGTRQTNEAELLFIHTPPPSRPALEHRCGGPLVSEVIGTGSARRDPVGVPIVVRRTGFGLRIVFARCFVWDNNRRHGPGWRPVRRGWGIDTYVRWWWQWLPVGAM